MIEQFVTRKKDVYLQDLLELDPNMYAILGWALYYCRKHQIPFVITSIKSDRGDIKTASKTHEQGRALDISVQGWSEFHVLRFCHHINKVFYNVAAVSKEDSIPRAAVYHDAGSGFHIHLQCKAYAQYAFGAEAI